MLPIGGIKPVFGSNPFCIGFPSSNGPVVYDMGTAALMWGDVMLHAHLGEPLPAGIGFDKDGNPRITVVTIAFGLTGLGFLIAWRMDSTQGFHAIMNLFLIPLWLLSGSLFPASGAAGWLGTVMAVNPLTYGVAALRQALYLQGHTGTADLAPLALNLGVTALFAAAMFAAGGA